MLPVQLANLLAVLGNAAWPIVAVADLLVSLVRRDDDVSRETEGKIEEAEQEDLVLRLRQAPAVCGDAAEQARERSRVMTRFVNFAFDAVRR